MQRPCKITHNLRVICKMHIWYIYIVFFISVGKLLLLVLWVWRKNIGRYGIFKSQEKNKKNRKKLGFNKQMSLCLFFSFFFNLIIWLNLLRKLDDIRMATDSGKFCSTQSGRQWINVRMVICDEWCPSWVCTEMSCL